MENKEIPRPKFLYHASSNKNISVFEPRNQSIRDPGEGKMVFGTPDLSFATMFLVRSKDDWSHKGKFKGVYYNVINDRKRFEEMDKGGSIYILPSESFTTDSTKGMGTIEWFSKVPVKPIKEIDYSSGLQAMLDNGVQVYFVDKETWNKIQNSNDRGHEILSKLESENKRVGKNAKDI